MQLIKQARFYNLRDAKLAGTVVNDLTEILDGYHEDIELDDDTEDRDGDFLFDYNSQSQRQIGFVPMYDGYCQSQTSELVYFNQRGSWLFCQVLLREKKIDPSQLRKEVEQRAAKMYEEDGETLGNKAMRELTEEVKHELMVKNSTMKYKRALVAISEKHGLIAVNHASPTFCEDVTAFLRTVIGSLPVNPYPDTDMTDNMLLRVQSAFSEIETELYKDDEGYEIVVNDWLKAEQTEEGKVNMRNSPDEVLETLVANHYRPVKYQLGISTPAYAENMYFNYEDRKITQLKTPEDMTDMLTEDIGDPISEYWAAVEFAAGTLDILVDVFKALGSDIDEDGSLGF